MLSKGAQQKMKEELWVIYKRFEKSFFKEDKTKDMVTYVKLRQQFRVMMMLTALVFLISICILVMYRVVITTSLQLLLVVLIGFRTKSYNIIRLLFFSLMTMVPAEYPSTSMVLVAPISILFSNMQVLIQTQSAILMLAHLITQLIVFYFYGINRMAVKIRELSTEELIASSRISVIIALGMACINLVTMKLFYLQFSKLLMKVNTLKDNLSKANNQLNDQNLKLQNNLEMKDVFIYTFSHELKNALNGLLGNLTLAYDSAKDDTRVLQFLASAKVCGEVLKNFIHNILDSGKLENGNLEVCPERRDVMNFMQSIWAICGKIIQNKRLKGSLEIERNVPRFLDLDEQRLIQIILNLVSNAVKFTETGHVRIRVSWQTISASSREEMKGSQYLRTSQAKIEDETEEVRETTCLGDMREFPDSLEARPSNKENHHLVTEYQKKFIDGAQCYQLDLEKSHWNYGETLSSTLPEGSKGFLKVQVVDSGCGMTIEQQGKLFQKFSQVSSVQGQRKIGTGLGLWICKELTTRLNGDIRTRSVVGVGSVFEFTVQATVSKNPLARSKSYRAPRKESFNSPQRTFSERRASNMLKILIADDDSFNIELMKNYLRKFGISYICAYDGEEAVLLFKKHFKEICFVITDNFMPKKMGTEAAFEIATFLEENRQPQIPIVCISGDMKVSVEEKGITSVIQKPINFDRLRDELMVVFPQLTTLSNEGER